MGFRLHSTVTAIVLLFGLLSFTHSQQNSLQTAEDALKKGSGVIEIPELNLNTSVLPALEEATNLVKQKCEKNGGPHAFENAKHAQGDVEHCLKSLINITKLQEDMEKYKPTGDLDLVFKQYCRKSPILKRCVTNFTTAIEPCLEENEKENKRIILNITDSLLTFVCHKEGDRIALFISAGGLECFQEKQQEVQDCMNATFGSYIPTPDPNTGSLPGLESLPALVFGNKECTDIMSLRTCVVKKLELCSDPTPANIVDSIFNFILRVTPCVDYYQASSAMSASTISFVPLISFLMIITVSLR